MKPRVAWMALLAAAVLAPAALGGEILGSRLAVPTVRPASREVASFSEARRDLGVPPSGLLAQRTITREWGGSEDTVYVEVDVQGYRSEGGAMLFSSVIPGAGQLYLGEASGYWFALFEVAAWASKFAFHRRADDMHGDVLKFPGTPFDPASNWSFSRYFLATHSDTSALEQLFLGDRDAFYHRIGFDERYGAGWKPDAGANRSRYRSLEQDYQRERRRERFATGVIIASHLIASIDALRAARIHNLPLSRNLRFRLEGSLEPAGPAMTMALERRF